MKLRTRLFITFGTMVILPLVLMVAIAYMSIGSYMTHTLQREYGFETVDYETLPTPFRPAGNRQSFCSHEFLDIIQKFLRKSKIKPFIPTETAKAIEIKCFLYFIVM